MYKTAKPLFIVCETPMHMGSGSDLGVIDLPIQRERHTDFPKMEASGIKGGLRESFSYKMTGEEKKKVNAVFGSEEDGSEHAAAIAFTDGRILCFPVKSMKGLFAWITCPRILERLKADMEQCNIEISWKTPSANVVAESCSLMFDDKEVMLEEYTFKVKKDDKCSKIAAWLSEHALPQGAGYDYWRNKLAVDLVVLSDDDFRDFANLSTEVITRIRINQESGTVAEGALFTEEYLPMESILYSLVLAGPIMSGKKESNPFANNDKGAEEQSKDVMQFFEENCEKRLQFGGSATLGKGLVHLTLC